MDLMDIDYSDDAEVLIFFIVGAVDDDIAGHWVGDKETVSDYLRVKISENPKNKNANDAVKRNFNVKGVDYVESYHRDVYYKKRAMDYLNGELDIPHLYSIDVDSDGKKLKFKDHDVLDDLEKFYQKYSEVSPRSDIYFPVDLYYELRVLEFNGLLNIDSVFDVLSLKAIEYSRDAEFNYSRLHANSLGEEWVTGFIDSLSSIDDDVCEEIINRVVFGKEKRSRHSDINESYNQVRNHIKDIVKELDANDKIKFMKVYAAFLSFWHCRYKGGDETLDNLKSIIDKKAIALSEGEIQSKPKIYSKVELKSPEVELFVMEHYLENGDVVFQWDGEPQLMSLFSMLYLDGKEYLRFSEDEEKETRIKEAYKNICKTVSGGAKDEESFDSMFLEYLYLRDDPFYPPEEVGVTYREIRSRLSVEKLLEFVFALHHRPDFAAVLVGGVPDLFVITDTGVEIIEVKSKRDSITGSQYALFNKIPRKYKERFYIQRVEKG